MHVEDPKKWVLLLQYVGYRYTWRVQWRQHAAVALAGDLLTYGVLNVTLKSPGSKTDVEGSVASATTITQPCPLPVSSLSASSTVTEGAASGSCPEATMTSATRSVRRLPMRPAGWFIAYCSLVSRFACRQLH